MDLLTNFIQKIPKRIQFTFCISVIFGLIVHFYMLTNPLINHDSLFNFYSKFSFGDMGRFMLKTMDAMTSYFDLHYLQGFLSVVFLALAIVCVVELFDLTNKWLIATFSFLYMSYLSVSSTMAFMFLSHGYFFANLLVAFSIFLCFKWQKKWLAAIISSILIYFAISTYQINIAYGATLVLLLFLSDLLLNKKPFIKSYITSVISLFFGLIGYIIHFKIYSKLNPVVDYNGINSTGNIDFSIIKTAHKNIVDDIQSYFFNNFSFERLFEILNVVYFVIFISLIIIVVIVKRVPKLHVITVIVLLIALPYTMYMIYFMSPEVTYHLVMKQHFALLFIFTLVLLQALIPYKTKIVQFSSLFVLFVLLLIAYNQTVISNIYYERLTDLNVATNSLMTRIVHDIEKVPGYTTDKEIFIVGNPSAENIQFPKRYNMYTPENVGVGNIMVQDYSSAYFYIKNEFGFPNPGTFYEALSVNAKETINTMPTWPNNDAIQIVDDVIIIKFSN